MRKLVLVVLVGASIVAPQLADALVMCGPKKPDGTLREGAPIRLRAVCRSNELQLDPVALGLQGPTGQTGSQGPEGPTGPQGEPGPQAADVSARVFNSAPIPVANNTDVILGFDSERFDSGDLHDPLQPSRMTAPVAGKYFIYCHASFPTNGTGARGLALRRNGTEDIAVDHSVAAGGYYTELSIATHFELQTGDYIEAAVAQNSGSILSVVGYPTLASPECGMVKTP